MSNVTNITVGGVPDSSEVDGPTQTNENGKQKPNIDFYDPNNQEHDGMEMSPMGGLDRQGTLIDPKESMRRAESVETLNLTLHQCARDGNLDNMKRYLQGMTGNIKRKINAVDEDKLSALHYAARYNHVDIVKLLIDKGADINMKGDDDARPLHYAARYKPQRLHAAASSATTPDDETDASTVVSASDVHGDVMGLNISNSVILHLLSRNADVNARDAYGSTPLHYAATRGNEVAVAELLTSKTILIEAVDLQQMTALHQAATHDEKEVARMLIEHGANLRCADEDGATPLHYACSEGNEEVVQMLFDAGEKLDGWVTISQMVTDQDYERNTALHLAVVNQNYEVVKICLKKGSDVNTHRLHYNTPLHLAATAGDVRIIELLIEYKARVDCLNEMQETPLHRAAAYDHADAVEFLIKKGARLEKHDKDNFTPLLIAACKGHASTIQKLLDCGADISAMDKNEKTAIYWAAEEDKVEALQVLLNNPYSRDMLDISDRYDSVPLHVACQNGYLGIVKMLLDHGADMEYKNEEEQTPLHLAAKNGKTHVVYELIKRNKTLVNDEDEESNSALHLAALAGHTKTCTALLENGVDIEPRNCIQWTPLDCAAAKGWPKTVKVLLEADCPVDPMDKSKTTPLHLASSRGHVEVVNILMKWNASMTQRDTNGMNCLDLAIDNGHKDVAFAIINSDKWEEALRNETLDLATGLRSTPMRKLIKKMPDVAERAFYRCTSANMGNSDHPDYEITFNYEFLDDMYAIWRENSGTSDAMSSSGSDIYNEDFTLKESAKPYTSDSTILKKNHPLSIMVNARREDLLAHPLVTSLLRHKWNSFGRYFYYINLFIYFIFLGFLTAYVIAQRPPFRLLDDYKLSKCGDVNCNNETFSCFRIENYWCGKNECLAPNFVAVTIGKWIIIGLSALNLFREIQQIFTQKLNYLSWENLLEWIMYIFAILFVVDFQGCQRESGIRLEWQWQIGAFCIFLAWMELVLFIRKVPRFGIYVVMFTDVLQTFIRFFLVFLLFMIAFALSYFMLFQNQVAFDNIGKSLVKTAVMMIGEFEFDSIFYGDEKLNYPEISYLLFVLFLVLMSIIIMNLLVGLAVDDIKAVQDQAVLKRLAMQVELALDVEGFLPHFIRRRFVLHKETLQPGKPPSCIKRVFKLGDAALSAVSIANALNPELDEIEKVQEAQEQLQEQVKNIRYRLKNIRSQNDRVESMLETLLKVQNVRWEEQDTNDDVDNN
ncbi:unnamed protein product [Owenia fusiformis]|uniref:Ion transport domain-containing protein n=1 Tax=Owenia fusiformis TaxID=6347 RepID=A0A8J1TBW1_OWEFU|nr:unnamed protein product [Owenia fusiformis]